MKRQVEEITMPEKPMKAKELCNMVIEPTLDKVKDRAVLRFDGDFRTHVITGLKMMINYPNSYIHTKKINPKTLKHFLNTVYAAWPLNFLRVYEEYKRLSS